MSDPIKLPFDPIPVGGGIATADAPRPSFSRSAPDASQAGLLPAPKKTVEKTPPVTLPTGIAPEVTEPNPAPGTPPPNPTAIGGMLQDLIRPSRSKLAIAAGMVSLFAGAYGLNLVMPTATPTDKRKDAQAKKEEKPAPAPVPTIEAERTSPQPVLERTASGILPVGNVESGAIPAPAPLPALPILNSGASTSVPAPAPIPIAASGPTPLPEPTRPTNLDNRMVAMNGQREQTERLPAAPSNPFAERSAALPLPQPNDVPKPASEASAPLPAVNLAGGGLPPARTELPALPPVSNTPAPVSTLPQPGGLPLPKDPTPTTPVGLPSGGTTPGGGLPALPAVELTPGGSGGNQDMKGVPLPGVAPFGEAGRTAELPKLPAAGTTPAALTSSNPGAAPAPIGLPPVKESPFKEERPAAPLPTATPPSAPSPTPTAVPGLAPSTVPVNTFTPAGGSVPAPATSPVESTPKTDFDVDLVRVRSGDTYASISEVFYGSKQYAAALRTFNRGADLGQLREVQVPPMHIIRKQVSTRDGGATDDGRGLPTGNSRSMDDGRGLPSGNIRGPVLDAPVQPDSPESIDWNSPGKRRSSGR